MYGKHNVATVETFDGVNVKKIKQNILLVDMLKEIHDYARLYWHLTSQKLGNCLYDC